MPRAAPAIPDRAAPPDPDRDRLAAAIPEPTAALLHIVRILLGYGRHLAATAGYRATAGRTFAAIAACFGTARLGAIRAHLQRGILRATALERVLLARAAAGRPIGPAAPRPSVALPPAEPNDPPAVQAALPSDRAAPAAEQAERQPAARPARHPGRDDPELFMPTLEELEAQVRRRPLGRTIVDICLDLAVVPGFCTGALWNQLFDIMRHHGGNVADLMREKARRQEAFSNEQDRNRESTWEWMEMGREALRQVLGFFIGEPPVDPPGWSPHATEATATGPP